jgi:hypothetical protein
MKPPPPGASATHGPQRQPHLFQPGHMGPPYPLPSAHSDPSRCGEGTDDPCTLAREPQARHAPPAPGPLTGSCRPPETNANPLMEHPLLLAPLLSTLIIPRLSVPPAAHTAYATLPDPDRHRHRHRKMRRSRRAHAQSQPPPAAPSTSSSAGTPASASSCAPRPTSTIAPPAKAKAKGKPTKRYRTKKNLLAIRNTLAPVAWRKHKLRASIVAVALESSKEIGAPFHEHIKQARPTSPRTRRGFHLWTRAPVPGPLHQGVHI